MGSTAISEPVEVEGGGQASLDPSIPFLISDTCAPHSEIAHGQGAGGYSLHIHPGSGRRRVGLPRTRQASMFEVSSGGMMA